MPHTYFPTASPVLKSSHSENHKGTAHDHLPSLIPDQADRQRINVTSYHPHWTQETKTRRPNLRHDYDTQPGAEPGVNPRRGSSIAEFSHFKQSCVIDVIDYDSDDVTFTRMGNAQLIKLMQFQPEGIPEEGAGDEEDEGDLPPRAVRWINVGGIDWSVLSAVALRYGLHSLALEDILHERGHNHSKADYYPGHLFIRVLCHSLEEENVHHDQHQAFYPVQAEAPELLSEFPSALSPSAIERGEAPLAKTFVETSDSDDTVHQVKSQSSTSGVQVLMKSLSDVPSDVMPNYSKDDGSASPPKAPKNSFANARLALRKRLSALSGFHDPEQAIRIKELKKGDRVDIKHEPMFIFLLHDGTVISLHPTPNLEYTYPIAERLGQPDSVLRTSEDASLLVESLLDLIVDRVLEMMDEYQVKIHDLEHKILLNPGMNTVRSLHILSGDLIMHKRTLDPIKTMIYGLRKYDLDRCIALADHLALDAEEQEEREEMKRDRLARGGNGKGKHHKRRKGRTRGDGLQTDVSVGQIHQDMRSMEGEGGFKESLLSRDDDDHAREMRRREKAARVEGYFSYKSKVYLADVYDHMDFALTSLDMFSGISENLINYAFNTASYEMNKVMNRLTLATIIFLPLTLLTGYFGMNFDPFWSVNHNSDLLFWKIAIPVMAFLIPIFMIDNIKRAMMYVRRRVQDRMVVRELMKSPKSQNG